MTFIDRGKGSPLVLIPGIQGRWEYLEPAIDALAESFRVLTFPLSGEQGCEAAVDSTIGMDNDMHQAEVVLDRLGIRRATICGISFGGLPAIRFAAMHPERTSALVLVSTPGPGWRLRPRHRFYARWPRLFGPLFLAESPFRLRAELVAALPTLGARWRFARWQLGTLIRAPLSLGRMATRAALMSSVDLVDDCARITAPTLVVAGEHELDRVLRVEGTPAYVKLISGARSVVLERTGHLGSVTRPEAFASIVGDFLRHPCGAGVRACDRERKAEALRHTSDAATLDASL